MGLKHKHDQNKTETETRQQGSTRRKSRTRLMPDANSTRRRTGVGQKYKQNQTKPMNVTEISKVNRNSTDVIEKHKQNQNKNCLKQRATAEHQNIR